MATVSTLTGNEKSTNLKRTINPVNDNELFIIYNDYKIVVNKRAWNMLTINAPVERIESANNR